MNGRVQLPDCPHCRAADSLEPMAAPDKRGTTLCECSCCSKMCRVDAAGEVLQKPADFDVRDLIIDGP